MKCFNCEFQKPPYSECCLCHKKYCRMCYIGHFPKELELRLGKIS